MRIASAALWNRARYLASAEAPFLFDLWKLDPGTDPVVRPTGRSGLIPDGLSARSWLSCISDVLTWFKVEEVTSSWLERSNRKTRTMKNLPPQAVERLRVF
jgi:hypothetical protein